MTKEEIFAMEAGEELSQKVAEEMMGECYHQHWDGDRDSITCLKCGESRFYHQRSQAYSIDISAAWQVVERFSKRGFRLDFEVIPGDKDITNYCNIYPGEIDGARRQTGVIPGNFMPEAICKAALLAKLKIQIAF